MEGSLYRNISIFWRKGVVPGTVPGVLSSGDPGRLFAGTRRPVSCLGSGRIQYLSIFPTRTPKPRPEAGPWKPEAGTRSRSRNPEAGTGTQKLETSARSMGHQTSLSVVLRCTSARCERICSLIGDVWSGEWTKIFDPMQTRDETLPPWWGLVGVGRKLDGEAGNVCIMGDASSHTPDTCAASVAILGLSSGRTSGVRRFNKTWRPKLRILMVDSAGLACASWACKSWGTFSKFVLVPGDNLVDSWYQSRSLGHVVCGEQ
ncbi:hypothetical protein F2Q68_00015246 [Brassica cretica]|uniref:Uncharacterized protein n=1 Tax=Brassica cretica TaxID=69181 RepID=A0A8S9HC81_BRACR|nr:hypothetical protein F2Q68_00015246 [Brassica cretica]